MDTAPLSQLADVVLPPAPDWTTVYVSVGALLLASAIVTFMLRWRRGRSHPTPAAVTNTPHQELQRIRAALTARTMSERDAAYRLATVLRLGLGVRQLPAQCPATIAQHRDAWPSAISALASARYQPASPITLDPAVLNYIEAWLRDASRSRAC